MMTFLCTVRSTWELDAISYKLNAAGVEFTSIRSAREYTSIVLGGGGDSFEILVEEKDLRRAQDILKVDPLDPSENSTATVTERNYFKRVVFFSLISIVFLPIVFNLVASLNFRPMLKQNLSKKSKAFATTLFFSMWVAAIIEVVLVTSMMSKPHVDSPYDEKAKILHNRHEIEIAQQYCANHSEELPPGTPTEPTEEHPLNGLWKLVGFECEGGISKKNLKEMNEALKSGGMSRLVRVMDNGVQYRLVDYNLRGSSCVTCMYTNWKLDVQNHSFEPQEVFGFTTPHGKIKCGEFTSTSTIKYSYEMKEPNLILSVQGKGFGFCESGTEKLTYLNLK